MNDRIHITINGEEVPVERITLDIETGDYVAPIAEPDDRVRGFDPTMQPSAGVDHEADDHRREIRETLRLMSDDAVRYQLKHGAPGGMQRQEIEAEAARRFGVYDAGDVGMIHAGEVAGAYVIREQHDDEPEPKITNEDIAQAANAVELLAGIDEGEHTDTETLLGLATRLRAAVKVEA